MRVVESGSMERTEGVSVTQPLGQDTMQNCQLGAG